MDEASIANDDADNQDVEDAENDDEERTQDAEDDEQEDTDDDEAEASSNDEEEIEDDDDENEEAQDEVDGAEEEDEENQQDDEEDQEEDDDEEEEESPKRAKAKTSKRKARTAPASTKKGAKKSTKKVKTATADVESETGTKASSSKAKAKGTTDLVVGANGRALPTGVKQIVGKNSHATITIPDAITTTIFVTYNKNSNAAYSSHRSISTTFASVHPTIGSLTPGFHQARVATVSGLPVITSVSPPIPSAICGFEFGSVPKSLLANIKDKAAANNYAANESSSVQFMCILVVGTSNNTEVMSIPGTNGESTNYAISSVLAPFEQESGMVNFEDITLTRWGVHTQTNIAVGEVLLLDGVKIRVNSKGIFSIVLFNGSRVVRNIKTKQAELFADVATDYLEMVNPGSSSKSTTTTKASGFVTKKSKQAKKA